ncbi:RNA polymerase-associated protein [Planoprotostelium fungivorum]|uniref:RNA polymerase-associated protein n=1 Tax=Planoprotostelium fungivorum TaxID=1890364 RepID=A0A2P6NSD4_9EUKA|nr:RNA polymerase-associated protein [Planoprotostelium fungivorum]
MSTPASLTVPKSNLNNIIYVYYNETWCQHQISHRISFKNPNMPEDVDDLLLGMTGGSKQNNKGGKKRIVRKSKDSSSESSSSSSDSSSDSEEEEAPRPIKQAPPKRPPKKRSKAEPESDEDNFNDGYDQDLFKDEEDRRNLMSMSEVAREEIISERFNRRKELREKHEMAIKLKNSGKTFPSITPTKDTGAASPASSRSKRNVQTGKTSKDVALESLKNRVQPNLEKKKKKKEIRDDSEASDFEDSDSEESGDDESRGSSPQREKEEREADRRNKKQAQEEATASLQEMSAITVKRDFLERKLNEPYFDEKIVDFYVRIGIGAQSDNRAVYRLARITGCKEGGRIYSLGGKATGKELTLVLGSAAKSFTMEYVSNGPPTEAEYQKWISETEKSGESPLTSKVAQERKIRLDEMENYVYTEQDVNKMLEDKRRKDKLHVNWTAERIKLVQLKTVAEESGDVALARKLQEEIESVTLKIESRSRGVDKVSAINQKSRQENIAAGSIMKIETEGNELDPFARRSKVKKTKKVDPKKDDNNNAEVNIQNVDIKYMDVHNLLRRLYDFDLDDNASQLELGKKEQGEAEEGPAGCQVITIEEYNRRINMLGN